MKKTIQTNISGLVFNVDEDAYEVLKNYLNEIRQHLKGNQDADEIIADIESNIAEKFSAIKSASKQTITISEVESLIKIMGLPEDFDEDASETEVSSNEPTINSKKLYRDMDNAIIGGVCAGLGNYFGIDPIFVRLLFILTIPMGGFGIVAYLILMIATPEAKTSSQKLEMHGEPVTLASLEQATKKSSQKIKEAKDWPVWKKILNIPIIIINAIILFLKNICKFIWPIIRFGFLLFVGLVGLIGFCSLTVATIFALINSQWSYTISDIPLHDIINIFPFYWITILSYIACATPFVVLTLLVTSFWWKKNIFSFKIVAGTLIIWILSSIASISLIASYIPKITEVVKNHPYNQISRKNISLGEINKLNITGDGDRLRVRILQSSTSSLEIKGRVKDLENLIVEEKNQVLTLKTKERERHSDLYINTGLSIIDVDVYTPKIENIEVNKAWISAETFSNNTLTIKAVNSAVNFEELNLKNLQAILLKNSNLNLNGKIASSSINLDDNSNFNAEKLTINKGQFNADNFSRFTIKGSIDNLNINLSGHSGWHGLDANSSSTTATINDTSKAMLGKCKNLQVIANDSSRVLYLGEPKIDNKSTSKNYKLLQIYEIPQNEYYQNNEDGDSITIDDKYYKSLKNTSHQLQQEDFN